jgi:phospho-N-acetylmuramoyl-pentapeptide-transferase
MLLRFFESSAGSAALPPALMATLVSFLLAILVGRPVIARLRRLVPEPNKSDSVTLERLHTAKQGTPSMGGLIIVGALVAAVALCGDCSLPEVWAALLVTLGLAAVGAIDDLVKLRGPKKGLSASEKLGGQFFVALIATGMLAMYGADAGQTSRDLPFVGVVSLGWLFVPLAALVIVASSNAVNLADGLDGLAGGCVAVAAAVFMIMGGFMASEVPAAGELTIVAGALLGAVLGFLRFNRHPAQIFMGDTGSLPLGGLLGLLAVLLKQELLWMVVGGVFVAEAVSVMLQVGWYKRTRRRLLRCAPLHHHFQFLGWPERTIVARFWTASACCGALGLVLFLEFGDFSQRRAPVELSAGKTGAALNKQR